MDGSSKSVMDSLPSGARGLFWIGNYSNTTCAFSLSNSQVATIVDRNRGDPKFSGIYYIADEPHTSNCPSAPADVAARTALVHSHDKNAKTFAIGLDGSNHRGEYKAFANSADYIGVDPYPCNVYNLAAGCDYTAMRNKIKAALAYVPANRMVPVFQTFGQSCAKSNYYRLPSVAKLCKMLSIWDNMVPRPKRPFGYACSWGHQSSSCPTLADSVALRSLMSAYFAGEQVQCTAR